jgi:hypothetical protein
MPDKSLSEGAFSRSEGKNLPALLTYDFGEFFASSGELRPEGRTRRASPEHR